jgi:hypothetical protein
MLQGPNTDQDVIKILNDCLKNKTVFEGKTINYDKNKCPFMMHWRVVPIIDNELNDSFYMAI